MHMLLWSIHDQAISFPCVSTSFADLPPLPRSLYYGTVAWFLDGAYVPMLQLYFNIKDGYLGRHQKGRQQGLQLQLSGSTHILIPVGLQNSKCCRMHQHLRKAL
jgi:hypothetical protein